MGDTPEFDTIGGRLSAAREASGQSLAQAARRLGIKSKTLSDWENDRSEPRANRLVMLAGMLNVTPAWILTGQGSGPSNEISSEELMLAKAELQTALKNLSEAQTSVEKAAARLAKMSTAVSQLEDQLDIE